MAKKKSKPFYVRYIKDIGQKIKPTRDKEKDRYALTVLVIIITVILIGHVMGYWGEL